MKRYEFFKHYDFPFYLRNLCLIQADKIFCVVLKYFAMLDFTIDLLFFYGYHRKVPQHWCVFFFYIVVQLQLSQLFPHCSPLPCQPSLPLPGSDRTPLPMSMDPLYMFLELLVYTTEFNFLTVLEAGSLNPRCQNTSFLLKARLLVT